MRTKIIFAVLILLLATILAVHLRILTGLTDDSYISFRYSKNLALGEGFRWNAGGDRVEGYTNFLWVLIGALAYLLRPDRVPLLMSGLGVFFLLLTIWIIGRILALQFPGECRPSLTAAFFMAASGPLILWSASGLETMQFAMFTAAGFLSLEKYLQTGRPGYEYQIWVIAFLLFLTRPDGIIFAAVMGFYLLLWRKGIFRKEKLLPFLAAFLIPFLIYNTWRITYFGYLLPNTFYAKATGDAVNQFKKGGMYLVDFSLTYLLPLLPLVLWLFARRKRAVADRSHFRTIAVLYLTAFTAYIVLVGGDYMAMYRFFVPLIPLIYLLAIGGFFRAPRPAKTVLGWTLLGAALLVTFLPSTPLDRRIWGGNKTYHYGCYEGHRTERWYLNRYITIGKLFRQLKKNENDSIVIPAIGAVGYFSGLNVIDYYGLTEPHIARMARKTFGENFPGHEKTDIDFILSKKPTYLMGYKRFSSYKVAWDHPMFESQYIKGDPERRALIEKQYRVRNIQVRDPLNRETGYMAFLERRDHD